MARLDQRIGKRGLATPFIDRRAVLGGGLAIAALASGLRPACAESISSIVNDASGLNPVRVAQVATPRSTDDVRRLIGAWSGPISIGGARFSMGGQIAAENSLHLDMRGCNQLVKLDAAQKTVRVQTGMRWRDLQTLIDPHDLAAKIMQSYSNFTIGGALSVNCHGRYVGLGPIVNSVRSIQLVVPGGTVIEASRNHDAQLFYGAIGGYAGLGTITEVELDLVANKRIERRVDRVPISRYRAFFTEQILARPESVLHNAAWELTDPDQVAAVTWFETERPVTVSERLFPIAASYALESFEMWALAELPGGHFLRRNIVDPIDYAHQPVVWRNHEASLDVASLGPLATANAVYALQEYFIPVAQFENFAAAMSRILRGSAANALNVSLRHSPADPGSIMRWAREPVFSFVLYYRQATTTAARQQVGAWTRQLVDAAISAGGTYYLPYQLHATPEQFNRAYPDASRFAALKAKIDPRNQFRNKLWDRYLPAV